MTRLGVVFWGGLVMASGFATFNVKYAVQGIEEELARARRQTISEQREIRVLSAEWAYLNQPERLAELNRKLLQLVPMTAKQLQGRVEEIALRAPRAPGPDAMPEMMPEMMMATAPAVGGALGATTVPAPSRVETLLAAAAAVPPLATAPTDAIRAGEIPVGNVRAGEGAKPAVDANGAEVIAAEARLPDVAGGVQSADADKAGALAEALQLLGIDAGGHHPQNWWAKAAPIAAAHAAEARGSDARSGETSVVEAVAGAARASDTSADTSKDAAAALAEALRVLGGDSGGQAPRVRLAKAAPASLDGLISRIADTR